MTKTRSPSTEREEFEAWAKIEWPEGRVEWQTFDPDPGDTANDATFPDVLFDNGSKLDLTTHWSAFLFAFQSRDGGRDEYAEAAVAACEAKASRVNAQSRVPMDGEEITEAKMKEYETFRVFLQARAAKAERGR